MSRTQLAILILMLSLILHFPSDGTSLSYTYIYGQTIYIDTHIDMCLTIAETKAFNMVCALDMIQIHIWFEYIVCMLNPTVLWWFQKFQYGICRGTHRWKDGVLTCVSPSMSTFKPCFSHVRKLLPPLNAQLQSLLPKPTILQPLICF